MDGAFSVQFARNGLLATQVRLDDYGFKVRSQPFAAKITESQFYQDPRDPALKSGLNGEMGFNSERFAPLEEITDESTVTEEEEDQRLVPA